MATGVSDWVKARGFKPAPYWRFRFTKIYYAIMVSLLEQRGSPFHQQMVELSNRYRGHGITFISTCSRPEYVWSCGLRPKSNRLRQFYNYGANIYGALLSRVYEQFVEGQFTIRYTIDTLVRDAEVSGDGFRRTALLLSDSMCKQVRSITGGTVVKVSGGKYHDLAEKVERRSIDVRKFQYIIVVCGVNHCRRLDYAAWERSWRVLFDVLSPVIFEGSAHQVIVNTPIRNPKAKFVKEHAQWIMHKLSGFSNITIVDWSKSMDNPFLFSNNKINEEFYCKDKFHVNHAGFREMWARWSHDHLNLLALPYKMSSKAYVVDPMD